MQTWDVIVVGGGIIGLSLSLALKKRGMKVLVVERSEPGREASSAAAGMLADCTLETPAALQTLATASANMYPEFVRELQEESGENVDLRDAGAIIFPDQNYVCDRARLSTERLLPQPLSDLEPGLSNPHRVAFFSRERSVDPRALATAALKTAKHREVDFSTGSSVTEILFANGRVAGVKTDKTTYPAAMVVNCAGSWASQLAPFPVPMRPIKGQMLCVIDESRGLLRHVIRSSEVYLVPRSDGRILIGTTLEDVGFDKQVDPDTIRRLQQAAIRVVPGLRNAHVHDAWAGLRPATPDHLPIMGLTDIPGYFVAAGHYRDGILLTPITAHLMAQLLAGSAPDHSLSAFSPMRFVALMRA